MTTKCFEKLANLVLLIKSPSFISMTTNIEFYETYMIAIFNYAVCIKISEINVLFSIC